MPVPGRPDPALRFYRRDFGAWMQQHPNVYADIPLPTGTVRLNPYRQAMRGLSPDAGPQVDLPAVGVPATASHAYAEWRADDQELVYWSIDIEGIALVNEALHADGRERRMRVVYRPMGGQDFLIAYSTPAEAAELLAAGWIVEAALPDREHVIAHDGLRFFGHRQYRLSNRASVIEAVLS